MTVPVTVPVAGRLPVPRGTAHSATPSGSTETTSTEWLSGRLMRPWRGVVRDAEMLRAVRRPVRCYACSIGF